MAKHAVEVKVPNTFLGKVDLDFIVSKDGRTFGTLGVSQGAVVWVPANGSIHRRLTWTQLAKFFEEEGKRL